MYEKMLVPLDGSEEKEVIIPYIKELASRLNTEVILFRVVEQEYKFYEGADDFSHIPFSEKEMQPIRVNAKRYLEEVGSTLKDKRITLRYEVRVGSPAREIVKFAEEIGVDIVAMSTSARSGISHYASGSIVDKVVHDGNTPVFLVRIPK